MKRLFTFLLSFALVLGLCACGEKAETPPSTEQTQSPEVVVADGTIELMGNTIQCNHPSVTVAGRLATINAGGEYTLRGNLDNGQIVVNAMEEGARVLLHMDGATITNTEAPCIYIQQADKVKLILDEGSENKLVSGVEGELTPPAAEVSGGVIFAEDDLDFEGSGKLEIIGYLNNGVTCKDDLAVQGGELTITAANNGLRASESLEVDAGSVTIYALGDGIKTTSAKKEGKGYISISGGKVDVECGGDGIAAETQLLISDGDITVTTTGAPELGSAKGLKAQTGIQISGGNMVLNTTDHAVRSFADLEVSGGSFTIRATMGRGFAALGDVRFTGTPTVNVDAIEDGIYSDADMYIDGGNFSIASGEDGLHAGQSGSGEGVLTISGGSILISAYQDGIDAKVALRINGGNVLSCGKSKVPKRPTEDSAQNSLYAAVTGHAGSVLELSDPAGNNIGSLNAIYPFTSVLFSRGGLGECTIRCDGVVVGQ